MKTATGLLLGIVGLFICFLLAIPVTFAHIQNLNPPGLADGAGIWVNLWHWPSGDLDSYCSELRTNGIRNIFLQISRSNTEAVPNPEQLGAIIEACHRYKIRVLAWSFAELLNPRSDADKIIAAARYQSKLGHRMDGIAGNMEKNLSSERVEEYSKALREALGTSYPMVAVVYSPLNHAPDVAHIPWTCLAKYWDVIAPMTYWGGRYQKLDPYTYTVQTVQKVRQLTSRPDIEIHLIGDGMGTTSEQVQQFFKACHSCEVASASLYPNHIPTAEQLVCLGRYQDYFPSNARFRLAAFRELSRSGILSCPPGNNPAAAIARVEFYRLVARQLFKRNPAEELSTDQALDILDNAGIVSRDLQGHSESLVQPIDYLEAISLIANCVEFQSSSALPGAPRNRQDKPRADRWLVEPAGAAAWSAEPAPAARAVNYLDAATLVLQARAGLR